MIVGDLFMLIVPPTSFSSADKAIEDEHIIRLRSIRAAFMAHSIIRLNRAVP